MPTENSENKNGKTKTEKAPEAAADATDPKQEAIEARRAALKTNGRSLYELVGKAGFTRDTFIELGESIKAEKPWDNLNPSVMKRLMRIGKDFRPVPVPDAAK